MNLKNILEKICDIIQNQLELGVDQIFIYNSKFTLPNDTKTYVSVGHVASKIISSSLTYEADVLRGQIAYNSINIQSTLDIDVLSKDGNVLTEMSQIIAALNSDYSQKVQEKNSFSIGRNPISINNISGIDGAAIPYRYVISINVTYFEKVEKTVDYYDTFEKEIVTEA